jgi:quinol monooxygenase YgiN
MKGKHLHLLPHASKALIDAVVRDEPGVLCYLWLQDLDDKRHVSVFEC